MKRTLLIISISISLVGSLLSDDLYKRVNVFIPDKLSFERFLSAGIDMEGATGKIGGWVGVTLSETELNNVRDLGLQTRVTVEDMTKYFSRRLAVGPANALGFGDGSMGGNYTFDEVVAQLDSMRTLYPDLITEKFSIGYTLQGRNMWAVRITKNPDAPSADPEVLYTALTHAREPQGMMNLIYFMWYLLTNYGTDPEATYLVDNRQLYFVPVINADGYEANRRISPWGGGMRRKNMRNVVTDNDVNGVDLNRNYGYQWGYDNIGSSPNAAAETYRGTGPFSEPEITNVAILSVEHAFKLALNYHSYGNLLLYPWDYTSDHESPDSVLYAEYGADMTRYNHYTTGPSGKSLYIVNGGATDWMYGDQASKNKIFSMLPEVGGPADGFWPATARILPIAIENLYPNLYLANAAGSFPRTQGFTLTDASGDGDLEPGESFYLNLSVRNKGLDSTGTLSLEITPSSTGIKAGSGTHSLGRIAPTTNFAVSLPCTVSAGAPIGPQYLFLKITEEPNRYLYDTIKLTIGKFSTSFADSAETGTGNWDGGIGWGISTSAHSPDHSFTDSPSGNYSDLTENCLTMNSTIDLSGAERILMKFWGKWEIEPSWDFVTVEASSDGGVTWGTVAGKYNKAGSGIGVQDASAFGYDGFQGDWVEEELDLSDYATGDFKLRICMRSDEYTNYDGFYLDDIRLMVILNDPSTRNITLGLNEKWNLVSIPVDTPYVLRSDLFTGSVSPAYGYSGAGYLPGDTMRNGRGYWIKMDSAQVVQIPGRSYAMGSFDVINGWNLIGSVSDPVPAALIYSDPPGMITGSFFGYNSAYLITDTIQPGHGYWVKVNGDGKLFLSAGISARLSSAIKISPGGEVPPGPPEISAAADRTPSGYKLWEAYPNPFNPATKIKFDLAASSWVTMEVYDLYGRLVTTLLNGKMEPGENTVEWNASGISSGIYFCKMTALGLAPGNRGIFFDSKKLVLLR